ncbi:carbohydrate esterase, partial [Streptomyces anthocyanicus]
MAKRVSITLLAALTLSAALSATPAHARTQQPGSGLGSALGLGLGLENCTAGACHFDVPPGTYDVRVRLGGEAAASTGISGETRRTLLAETPSAAGEPVTRSFTVNV